MKESNKTNWKWKPKRWWLGLILFWFISTGGAGIIARSGGFYSETHAGGFIGLIMLIFAIFAACTDRNWSIPKRIFWVIGIYIMYFLLEIPACLIAGLISKPHLVERTTSLLACIPLVIWVMRRSKFFVEPTVDKNESKINTSQLMVVGAMSVILSFIILTTPIRSLVLSHSFIVLIIGGLLIYTLRNKKK